MLNSTTVLVVLSTALVTGWQAPSVRAEASSEAESAANEAFWSKVKPYEPPAVDASRTVKTPETNTADPNASLWRRIPTTAPPPKTEKTAPLKVGRADRMLSAQSVYASRDYEGAEAAFRAILEVEPVQPPALANVARQWLLLSVMNQKPFPADRAEELAASFAADGHLTSPEIWNLSLRLLLRQTTAAPPESKAATWRNGVNRLRIGGDGMIVDDTTLAEIDGFLDSPEKEGGLTAIDLLNTLMVSTPHMATMRELNNRRYDLLARDGPPEDALRCAWLQVLLSTGSRDAMLPAVGRYADRHQSTSGNAPTSNRALAAPTNGTASYPFADRSLSAASAQALGASGDAMPPRRRAMLQMFAGDRGAFVAIGAALAEAALADAPARVDELAMIESAFAGELIVPKTILESPPVRRQSGLDADAFGSSPVNQQRRIVKVAVDRMVQRRRAWASHALDADRDEIAASFWTQALALSAGADGPADMVTDLAEQLRALTDPERAATVLDRITSSLDPGATPAELVFLRTTFLYEQGEMEGALASLDQAEEQLAAQWDDDERLAAGLIRAVAEIKLRRLDAASSTLAELSRIEGATEQLAQVTFLRGWIALNQNKTSDALGYFRMIVDKYPGSSYTAKARELIQRLEFAELTR